MKKRLIYVELKSGYNDDGPAWIGKGFYSKSGNTIYFNGKILKGSKGECFELSTRDIYWISGVKKNGEDRHPSGKGIIYIDNDVVNEYLQTTGLDRLPVNKFSVINFDNEPKIAEAFNLENRKLEK